MAELYLFNKEEVLINVISEEDFNNDSHARELNSKWSFEFTTTFQYLNDLSKSNKVGFYDRYGEFRLFKIIKEPEVDYLNDEVVVNCLNDCYEMSDQIIEDKRLRDGTARQALDKVLEGSNYEVGEVAELGNRTINFYDISRMEGLNNIIKSYGGELDYRIEFDADFKRISHKYVDIKSRLGQDTGLRFTYDLNLESVVRKDVSESHCTVLYGRGGAIESGEGYSRKIKFTDVEWTKPTNPIDKPIGQNYIEDLDAIAKYGRIEGIYENSDIKEPGELLQATYEALQECKNPKLSYEVNAKDLASQNSDYDHLTVVLGDSVILLDEDYDLNFESRIVGFEESIKEGSAEMKWIIGGVQSSFSSDNASPGQIVKPSTGDEDTEINDGNFPDTLPAIPIVEAEGLFGSVILSWTYESKSYYEYELYASKLENFNPDASNLIFRGKASSYHHQVKPSETWYFRARAINTHGRTTDFSSQVQASTLKIEDGTEYFEKAAIADALIGELRLDRGWVGQLKGNWIDAKQLTVTDGNGKRTLDIDSFGNVNLDVAKFVVRTTNGAYTVYDNSGMNTFNNGGAQTLGIHNGGITFHPWNTQQLGAYVTQSSLWGGDQSANGLALSTTANGSYVSIGTSALSDPNSTLSMEQALTISARDSFQPQGINFWKNVHAHGYGIRQLSHLDLAGSSPIRFDYLNNSPSIIYEAVDNGHSLHVMGGYQMHLGVMEGDGTPHGVIWMKNKTDTHSYTHWDFHNYTMHNMRTASSYVNVASRKVAESYGIESNVDGIRYLYKDIKLVNGKAVRNIPSAYAGATYDIVSIVCKGKGQAWIEVEDSDRFEINGDCTSVNVEIIIHPHIPSMAAMSANISTNLEEGPILELPKIIDGEVAPLIKNRTAARYKNN